MALYLVTGQPGHGKTAYALDKAFKLQKEGRAIYAHGVKDLDYQKAGFTYVEDPTKWQELPDGSVVLLDECYTVFPNRNPGAKVPDHVEAMARHRHRGFDFILIAQQGLQLDPFLRGLYEEHVHVRQTSVFKAKTKLKRWTAYQNNVNAVCGDVEDWVRPKYVFDYYTSTTKITTTRRVPMWARYIIALLVILLTVGWYLKYRLQERVAESQALISAKQGGTVTAGDGTATGGRGADPATGPTWLTPVDYAKSHLPRFGVMPWTAEIFDARPAVSQPELYCMSSMPSPEEPGEPSCTCLTEQGTRYTLSQPECRTVARHGTPYNPYKQPQVAQAALGAPIATPVLPAIPTGSALAGSVVAGKPGDVVGSGNAL